MSEKPFVLTIDQGTTSSRAILFERNSTARAVAQLPITQHYPSGGWVDHDASEIWQSVRNCVGQALSQAGITLDQVSAIGITNQRETTVVWDRMTGEPLAPAIVWQSRQSVPYVDAVVRRGMGPRYHELTGLVPDAYFSATKLALILDEHPEIRARAEAGEALFGTVDSWLIYKLSRGAAHVTDVTNASRTMLFDIHRLDWSDELLGDLGIPRSMLPRVVDSSGWAADVAEGKFEGSAPISGIAGDQHASLFGQLCFEPGEAKNTIGTGSFLLMNTGSRPRSPRGDCWRRWAGRLDPRWSMPRRVRSSFLVQRCNGCAMGSGSSRARRISSGSGHRSRFRRGRLRAGAGWARAPHWDSTARGGILGSSRGTTAGHLAHATIEGIALQAMELVDLMRVGNRVAGFDPQDRWWCGRQ